MPIRVLIIAPSMNTVGGHSVQADRILKALAGDRELHLRLHAIDQPIPPALRKVPFLRTAVNAAAYYVGLIRQVLWADVIHAFTASFWGYSLWTIPAILLSRLTRRKIIVNYHDGRAESHLEHWPSAVATLRYADVIVVPSQYLVEVFRRYGFEARAIPNAIDVSAFPWRERTTVQPSFITSRGLEELYDVQTTLRAFRIVQDSYPQARFVVSNDGPLRGQLEALAGELQLNAVFSGAVNQSRMAELYDSADIYVMSPRIDNMPLTVIECFACGIPVVSTNIGGVPFIAQHESNALLVPPGSPRQLAEACIRLLREPGLAHSLAIQGRLDCIEKYSVESVRQLWANLYRMLGQKG